MPFIVAGDVLSQTDILVFVVMPSSSLGFTKTHLLRLRLIVGVVPLLGLVRSRGNLPGRLAELLGRRLCRHFDSLLCLVSKCGEGKDGKTRS